ncbi:hypothetical protein ACSBR1_030097 [Camellia fascicularis]
MEKKLVATYNDSRAWCVSQANDDVYEVHSHPSVGTIYPIPTVERPAFNPTECLIAPPLAKRPSGRPKRKRIPSKSEVVQRYTLFSKPATISVPTAQQSHTAPFVALLYPVFCFALTAKSLLMERVSAWAPQLTGHSGSNPHSSPSWGRVAFGLPDMVIASRPLPSSL